MWFPFLMLDGMLLYGVIGLFSLLALISMENERPATCSVILVIALVVLEYTSAIRPISFIITHPMDAAMMVGAYFVAGSVWIIVKWLSHVYKVRDQFNEIKEAVISDFRTSYPNPKTPLFNGDGSLTDDGMKAVYQTAAPRIGEQRLPLQVSQHKAEIYMWWICWPLSLFWTILSDPITRLWHFVYNLFGNWMQAISDNAFKLK